MVHPVGSQWLPGPQAGEQPRRGRVGRGLHVRPVSQVLAQQLGDGWGNGHRVGVEGDGHVVAGVVDVGGTQPAGAGDGLGVEQQQQDPGDAVGDRRGGLPEAAVEQAESLLLVQGGAGTGMPVREGQGR